MVTGYEVDMYHHIDQIAKATARIAVAVEQIAVAVTVEEPPAIQDTELPVTIEQWVAMLPPYVRDHMAGYHRNCPPAECSLAAAWGNDERSNHE